MMFWIFLFISSFPVFAFGEEKKKKIVDENIN